MKKSYIIKKVQGRNEDVWSAAPALVIDCYPWDKDGYKPRVEVRCLYDDQSLHVKFTAYEKSITVRHFHINEPVYKDSCVEFFINPRPEKDPRYLNFEINPLGVFLLEIGEGRNGRQKIIDVSDLSIRSSVDGESLHRYSGEYWTIELLIPFAFLEKYYGPLEIDRGSKMAGNFYKCGDETPNPHYGCWNPIINETPDFHRPEFFGELIFEEDIR